MLGALRQAAVRSAAAAWPFAAGVADPVTTSGARLSSAARRLPVPAGEAARYDRAARARMPDRAVAAFLAGLAR